MKKLIILLFLSVLTFSCEKDTFLSTESDIIKTTVDIRNGNLALEMVNDLIDLVTGLVDQGDIPFGPGQSILSKLESIKKKLEDGKINVALTKIDALLEHMEELVESGLLDIEIYDTLVANISDLACEASPFDGDGDGSPCNVDCNDEDDSIFPGAEELCSGGIDEDCDEFIDCDDSDCELSLDCYFGPTSIFIFWKNIMTSELDGNNLQNMNINTEYVKTEVAIDKANNMIYWCENSYHPAYIVRYYRAQLNGNNVELLLEYNFGGAQGLVLDLEDGKLYGSDGINGNIFRMNLDGSDVELIYNGNSQLGRMAIDFENEKLYWIDRLQTKLYRSNLDGTSIEEVLSDLGHSPNGLQIDFETGIIYYSDLGESRTVNRINMDGSGHQVFDSGYILDISLDLYNNKLYWADPPTQTVKRCDLDGTNIETILVNFRSYGIALN